MLVCWIGWSKGIVRAVGQDTEVLYGVMSEDSRAAGSRRARVARVPDPSRTGRGDENDVAGCFKPSTHDTRAELQWLPASSGASRSPLEGIRFVGVVGLPQQQLT